MSIDRWLRIAALRLRSIFRRRDVDHELDAELAYHVERQTEENERLGMAPDAARAAALRALGNLEIRKEQVRATRRTRWAEELPRDLALGVRGLRRAPGFAAAVVLTLALGIGANTAMFTLLRGTLLRPLPNRDGDRLVYLRQSAATSDNVLFSVPEVADYRAGARSLAELAEFSSAVPFTIAGDDGAPARARVGIVSGNYFDVMGLEPAVGRLTTPRDDGPAAAPVAVLSYPYWMEHFGGDAGIVGRTVRLNDIVTTIVGVAQPAPSYPQRTDVFVNTVVSPHHLSATMVTDRSHRMTELFGRLAPGATVEQARLDIERLAARARHDHPEAYAQASHYTIAVSPLKQAVNARASLTVWLLMGAAAFVLLIACANVSNLTLMRGVDREREMLVRAALGAGRGRLRRLLLVENLALALTGGALGVLVAFAGVKLLVAFAAQLSPRAAEIRVDGVVLAVGLATSVAVAIALSFVPRIGGARTLAASLAPAGRRVTLDRGRQRFQQSLVVAQLAVCMVLLTGAGLLARTLTKLASVDTGVRAAHVLTMELPLDGDLLKQVMRQPENLARYERMRDRVAALPGVELASVGSAPPLRSPIIDFDVKAESVALPPDRPTPHPALRMVDGKYFTAAGIPMLAGRPFATTDARGTAAVVIVSRSLARELFGDRDPLGQHVALTGAVLKFTPFSGDWRTVVGVVGDTRDRGLDGGETPTLYMPFAQEAILGGALVVRTTGDPETLQRTILRAVRDVSPRQLVENVATLEALRDKTVAPRRLNALFIASFGALALIIAMVGIAGVLAFSVSARVAEIAIRMSLGANPGRVYRMVLGEGGALLGVGVAVGVLGALAATRAMSSMLFGVTPHDPVTLVGVALVLVAVGVAACWLPAARAAHVDPAVALRAE
ncbi:permease (plasmid) [Gemmatirosa kalamazoonensis]|uniref:Permease n=1 Tax=Gemmatirosa kalamazoonensis TaxID=861299 RepID=W0RPT5_9BACT|nr:ABC transporter permease [Gemmatirosa kalamazoonensis]AHG92350.1 permease [Gemmatirosa kalamazoonensis]